MINQIYAGFWKRFAAVFIDVLILVIPQSLFGYLFGMAFVNRSASIDPVQNIIGFELWSRGVALGIAWLYFAILESSKYQATIGKMALGIIVTDLQGNRISFGRASGRFFGKLLSAVVLCTGYFMAGFTSRKQALHDLLAQCLVVSRVTTKRSSLEPLEDQYEAGDASFYLTAKKELDSGSMHEGIWAKSYQLHPGDENLRRASYLKLRVSHLRAEEIANRPPPTPFAQTKLGKKLKELIPLWIIAGIALVISGLVYFDSYSWLEQKKRFAAARQTTEEAKWDAVVRGYVNYYGDDTLVHVSYTVNGEERGSQNHYMIAYRGHSVRCYNSTNTPFNRPDAAMDGVDNIRVYKGPRVR